MADKNDAPVPAIQDSPDGLFVTFGFEYEGAFHPIASERKGDYTERIEAAKAAEKS